MNIHLAGKTLDQVNNPDRTVLFFEAKDGSPLAGGPELRPAFPRVEDAYLVAFVDGHVESVSDYKTTRLVWDARESQDSPVVLQTPPPATDR